METKNVEMCIWLFLVYCREQRSGNTLYQELSFQDAEALGEMDEGADITGIWFVTVFVITNSVTIGSC